MLPNAPWPRPTPGSAWRKQISTLTLYLTGLAGLESLNFNSFFNAASGYYAVGPGITWKVFDADKIRSEVFWPNAPGLTRPPLPTN